MTSTATSPFDSPNTPLSLLDCTLRDGGYYTAWDFDQRLVDRYLAAVSRLPIDTVELGYCSPPRDGYAGKHFFLSPDVTRDARAKLAPSQSLAVMLDEKSVTADQAVALVEPHLGAIDTVRIAVAPSRLIEAAQIASALIGLGLKVGVNVMYLSTYWGEADALPGLSEVASNAYAVSLVDSYGACNPDQVHHSVQSITSAFPQATVGFHGHDNLGLALANSLAARAAGATIADGTITGMGRGPGNTKTEQLLYATHPTPLDMDYVALHDAIEPFELLRNEYQWGTNLVYMVSGAAGLPQNKVMDWLGKNRYSVPAIIHAMRGELMTDIDSTDYPVLSAPNGLTPEEVVIIGGGASVIQHSEGIASYVRATGACVVHANYRHLDLIERLESDQFVCVAGDVVMRLPSSEVLSRTRSLVVPAGPRVGAQGLEDIHLVTQADPFVSGDASDNLGPISDIGPVSLALGTALALGARRVTLIGFDGYENATSAQQELAAESQALFDDFRASHPEIALTSGTRTRFEIVVRSIYARIAEVGTRLDHAH